MLDFQSRDRQSVLSLLKHAKTNQSILDQRYLSSFATHMLISRTGFVFDLHLDFLLSNTLCLSLSLSLPNSLSLSLSPAISSLALLFSVFSSADRSLSVSLSLLSLQYLRCLSLRNSQSLSRSLSPSILQLKWLSTYYISQLVYLTHNQYELFGFFSLFCRISSNLCMLITIITTEEQTRTNKNNKSAGQPEAFPCPDSTFQIPWKRIFFFFSV